MGLMLLIFGSDIYKFIISQNVNIDFSRSQQKAIKFLVILIRAEKIGIYETISPKTQYSDFLDTFQQYKPGDCAKRKCSTLLFIFRARFF